MGFFDGWADYLNETERRDEWGPDWKQKFEAAAEQRAQQEQALRLRAFEERQQAIKEDAQRRLAEAEGGDVAAHTAKIEKLAEGDAQAQRERLAKADEYTAAQEAEAVLERGRKRVLEGRVDESYAHELERRPIEERLRDAWSRIRSTPYVDRHLHVPRQAPKGTTLRPSDKDYANAEDAANERFISEFGEEALSSPTARAQVAAYTSEALGEIMDTRMRGLRTVGGGGGLGVDASSLPGGGHGPIPIEAFLALLPNDKMRSSVRGMPDNGTVTFGRRLYRRAGSTIIPIPSPR